MASEMLLAAPLLATVIFSILLATLFWKRSSLPCKSVFMVLLLDVGFLAGAYLIELMSIPLDQKLLMNGIEHISFETVSPLFFILVLRYTGNDRWLGGAAIFLIFLIPALVILGVWTNEMHHLYFRTVTPIGDGWFQTFDATYGPLSVLGDSYGFTIMGLAIGVSLFAYRSADQLHRKQIALVALSGAFPTLAAIVSIFGPFGIPFSYALTVAFMFSAWALFLAMFRYELFTIPPVALNKVIESMMDGAIVLDNEGRVIYVNPSAERILQTSLRKAFGKNLGQVAPFLTEAPRKGLEQDVVELKDHSIPMKYLHIQSVQMSSGWGRVTGRLLILRDFTAERQAKEALRTANDKLKLLSSVTRHDIMNKIAVIRGYGDLMRMSAEGSREIAAYSEKIAEASGAIERFVGFTKEYQNLGVNAPEWQEVGTVFDRAKALSNNPLIEYCCEARGLEVYADPMLERVFYILLDNTNRHAGRASTVRLDSTSLDGRLVISYHDNGVGVPVDLKERIFEMGFGNNTGLGLYLGKQILSITDISIAEAGEESKGARFDIVVPRDYWRQLS